MKNTFFTTPEGQKQIQACSLMLSDLAKMHPTVAIGFWISAGQMLAENYGPQLLGSLQSLFKYELEHTKNGTNGEHHMLIVLLTGLYELLPSIMSPRASDLSEN